MPISIESIVSAYVRLGNQRALQNMRDLRRKLLETVQATSSIDPAQARDTVLEDLRAIEEGLEKPRPPPGTVPENEWR